MNFQADAVLVEPATHSASIIWLHGLGADGHDFEPIVPELGLPSDHGIRFIFPNAPMRSVTINSGMQMRAWYDVRSPNLKEFEDETSINESADLVNHYIAAEIEKGVDAKRVLLAGFSQGGAIALHAGLRYPQTLAGILALSTYLPCPARLVEEQHEANKQTPVIMAHGIFDPVIPVEQGKDSSNTLKQQGYDIQFWEYTMEHSVSIDEISAIGKWIQKRLN